MRTLANIRPLRWVWPALVPIVILAIVTLAFSFGSPILQRIVTTMIINLIAVVGLYIFVGNSGVFSFGHVAFMGIGAYTAAILSVSPKTKAMLLPDMPGFLAAASLPTVPAILIGGVVAAVFALIVAFPLMRMKSIALPIGTFALAVIVHTVTIGWKSLTGGTGTMTGIPIKATLWLAFVFAAAVMLAALVFQKSRIGMRLKGAREDEVAARAIGIGVLKERTWAWLISAFVMGLAGGLYAHQLGMLHPDGFWFATTILLVVMLIAGGMRSLAGAFVGTLGISLISELLRRAESGFSLGSITIPARPGLKELAFAVILMVVLIWRRQGVMGNREFELPAPSSPSRPQGGKEQVGP